MAEFSCRWFGAARGQQIESGGIIMVADLTCAIVMPFLDEERNLAATCSSLGFGNGRIPASAGALFLVDNGSTDGSAAVARDLERSLPGLVHCVLEPERGYVPARAAGNRAALRWAEGAGVAAENVLLIQADADTSYRERYVDTVHEVALRSPPNVLFEALVGYEEEVLVAHANYFKECEQTEHRLAHLFPAEVDDCLVDDKVAAYRLSSYLAWGGHRREYDRAHDEMFAETTRLFIAARGRGAKRIRVEGARAEHSARRLEAEPLVHTATAGFPRGRAWRQRWLDTYGPEGTLESAMDGGGPWRAAWRERRLHLLALLVVLPLHVRRTCDATFAATNDFERLVLATVPSLTLDSLIATPGRAVDDSLGGVQAVADALEHADLLRSSPPDA